MCRFNKILRLLPLLICPNFLFCQQAAKPVKLTLIPEPVTVTLQSGQFVLNAATSIQLPAGQIDWQLAASALADMVQPSTGFALPWQFYLGNTPTAGVNQVVFQIDSTIKQAEAYRLDVSNRGVIIRAQTAHGAFYAVQTLRQLFPASINSRQRQDNIQWAAPACMIADYPRFGYRGLHLDVGRHYFPVSFIKRYIDLLAFHKMNSFHWHLTEDQGWRIEIKRYPRLQTVGACRKETLLGHYSDQPQRFDGVPYCHFYTQEEVREVVEYARQHFVTVIPEIEMPGHAQAALAAYPELGCTGGPYQTVTTWGVHEEVFCAGNDAVYEFLDNVLEEICALFPGQYIHVGGDECPKERWKTCPKCQARIRNLGLKDEHALQSYVIGRAATMLAKHGKKLIGWDEILEGGLEPTATVMSWRGEEGGIAAAQAGHDAIMTPGSYCYFDYYQSDPNTEPLAIGGLLTLEKVYSYDPVPAVLTPEQSKHILGVQGNLWTEYIANGEYAEYMAYPRACALAEVAWSPKNKKNWTDFARRLQAHFIRLDAMSVRYAMAYYDIHSTFEKGKVRLKCADPDLQIRYTTDGTVPSATSPLYTLPFALKKTTTITAAGFRGANILSKVLTVNYTVHKASGKPYTLSKQPKQYNGGEKYALTNGIFGGLKTWDAWTGLVNHDIDPVIDLGVPTSFDFVSTHFIHSPASWIYAPRKIEIFVSTDAKTFRSIGVKNIDLAQLPDKSIQTVTFEVPKSKARYIKLVATTQGVIPAGNPGAGEGAWLFLDEVEVE